MPGSSHKSPIDKLDTPCLVRVLRQLSSQQQLVACGAVCSKWRKATREATSGIDISRCTQQQCDQLQKWAVHPPAALYKLCLHGQIPRPVLRLHLSVLQHLRHLELQLVRFEAFVADGSLLTVVDLLPRLQHCTKLILRTSYNCDLIDAAAAFPAMPALQDLDIDGEDAGLPCSLVELPTTLTRLCLESLEAINPTNAATISQLTGLRVLEATTYGFDPSVLANCVSLERIEINIKDGGYHFSGMEGVVAPLLVFGSMPNLEHLLLQSWPEDPVATSAEVAALSASSNLTYLSLGYSEYCLLAPAECDTWFPAGRHCPLLQHLDMGVWVLGNSAAVQRMVSACPGLQELELRDPDCDLEDSDLNAMGLESANVAASLQALTNLTSLTHLRVDAYDLPEGSCISPAVVKAWSHWTNLQQLELEFRCRKLEDVLVLTQLRSLHNLDISGYNGGECDRLKLMAQANAAPNVWCQLPAAVWGVAIRHKEQQVQQRLREQRTEQARAAALLEQQATAQAQAASLSQQHAAAVERVAALQHEQAAAQAKVAALQQQQAAEQAELAALLQKQQQAEAAVLRERLQLQQAGAAVLQKRLQQQQVDIAVMRQQADADRTQLQGQVASLQATVAALLERHG